MYLIQHYVKKYLRLLPPLKLNNIKKWGDTWLVKFNPNETEIMIFNIRNQQDELSFDCNGIVLNSVNKHQHLGIIFRSDCKMDKTYRQPNSENFKAS